MLYKFKRLCAFLSGMRQSGKKVFAPYTEHRLNAAYDAGRWLGQVITNQRIDN